MMKLTTSNIVSNRVAESMNEPAIFYESAMIGILFGLSLCFKALVSVLCIIYQLKRTKQKKQKVDQRNVAYVCPLRQ